MKLLTFQADGVPRIGVLRDEKELVEIDEQGDMLSLIEAGDAGVAAARSALSSSRGKARRLDSVELLSPIPLPRCNVIAIGRNYQKHAAETAALEGREPSAPTFFTKAITSLTDPYADFAIDAAVSDKIDWEVELGVIIGQKGVNINRSDARRHVFGYTVFNDVSARDIQADWGGQYFKGKSLDRSSPMGPWIVTADEISDPQNLRLQLHVDGVMKQDGSTRDMIYSIDAVIEWVSIGMTLLPGTIIATGTPDGVGFARTPPEFLKPGDVMETEVEGIGKLRNRIVSAGRG